MGSLLISSKSTTSGVSSSSQLLVDTATRPTRRRQPGTRTGELAPREIGTRFGAQVELQRRGHAVTAVFQEVIIRRMTLGITLCPSPSD